MENAVDSVARVVLTARSLGALTPNLMVHDSYLKQGPLT